MTKIKNELDKIFKKKDFVETISDGFIHDVLLIISQILLRLSPQLLTPVMALNTIINHD